MSTDLTTVRRSLSIDLSSENPSDVFKLHKMLVMVSKSTQERECWYASGSTSGEETSTKILASWAHVLVTSPAAFFTAVVGLRTSRFDEEGVEDAVVTGVEEPHAEGEAMVAPAVAALNTRSITFESPSWKELAQYC